LETKIVKDLMVPLSEYATVSKEATLSEAVMTLKEAQKVGESKYVHRAVLVYDKEKRIVGKLDMLSVLRALEPKYDEMLPRKKSYHLGLPLQLQKTMLEQLRLWDEPLDHICQKAVDKKVKNFMIEPTEGEHISQSASINEAIHQLVMGAYQSLLVTEGKKIIGILRLTDVFEEITNEIAACKI
jgi:CBS domain-containing protein